MRTWRLGSHVPLRGGHSHSQSPRSSIFSLRPMMACHQRQHAKGQRGTLRKDRAGAATRLQVAVPRRARPSGPAPARQAPGPLPCGSQHRCPADGAATVSRRSGTSSWRTSGPPEQAPGCVCVGGLPWLQRPAAPAVRQLRRPPGRRGPAGQLTAGAPLPAVSLGTVGCGDTHGSGVLGCPQKLGPPSKCFRVPSCPRCVPSM